MYPEHCKGKCGRRLTDINTCCCQEIDDQGRNLNGYCLKCCPDHAKRPVPQVQDTNFLPFTVDTFAA